VNPRTHWHFAANGNGSNDFAVTCYDSDIERLNMSEFVFFLIPIALAVTAVILGLGIYSMARGGTFSRENGNKLMRLRVTAQAVAIAIMMLFLWLVGKGPGG